MATNGDAGAGRYVPFPAFGDWPIDSDTRFVDAAEALLQQSRASVSREALDHAVEVATRFAAVDTGAIEGLYTTNRGFTLTIATQAATWQAALRERGEEVARAIDDALTGYQMVLDLVTRREPLSESWIRQLHETLCRSQETYEVLTEVGWQRQPLPKGSYKTMPNNPTSVDTGHVHHYAPPSDVPSEMTRLVEELRSPTFEAAHPVVQAAYAHYGFVAIHPFADGNGRVARALASVYLYRRPGVPLVVFADQKGEYLDALEAADRGNPRLLNSFVGLRAADAVELVREQLKGSGLARDPGAALTELVDSGLGIQHHELDAVSRRVAAMAQAALMRHLDAAGWPQGTSYRFDSLQRPSATAPPGYRSLGGGEHAGARVVVEYTGAVSAHVATAYFVWPRTTSEAASFDIVVTGTIEPNDAELHLREVHPQESQVGNLKIDAWASRQVRRLGAQLSEEVARQLEKQGYVGEDRDE